jgi:hypothetical protein
MAHSDILSLVLNFDEHDNVRSEDKPFTLLDPLEWGTQPRLKFKKHCMQK